MHAGCFLVALLSDACATLSKLLGNVQAAPAEPKFRRLRTSNAKISMLLQTRGVRALLLGAGFVEEGADFLVLPEAAPLEAVQAALDGLAAEAASRDASGAALKAEEQAKRKERADKENEDRKRMQLGIQDDAAARKEPGWKAKAAGVKTGRAVVGCGDVGCQGSGG